MTIDDREVSTEENETGLLEGDQPLETSSARAALGHRDFRVVFLGAFASNIGTWMQNVTLGALAYELTKSPTFVSLVTFAQLGPMLVLSVVGGVIADAVDRRKMTMIAQTEQAIGAVVLALVVMGDEPNRTAIVLAVLAIGIGNALNAPAWVAFLPSLVPKEHMSGAISLNSTQMNASRVIGPAIAGVLYPFIGASGVFFINAVTYGFTIAGVALAKPPPQTPPDPNAPKGFKRLASGFAIARRDPLVRRILGGLFVFSLLCLPFIGQMPTIAAENLDMDPESLSYGLLYACFGLGAVTGAVSIGTFLSNVNKRIIVQRGLLAFSVLLAAFGLVRVPGLAYPVIAGVGFSYFATVTALNTVLQVYLPDAVRGRVMSLWLMAFGGTVPIGLMIAGPIAEATNITTVVLYGAVVAALLLFLVRPIEAEGSALVEVEQG
ncbi:MAG TPA: MFS transporter [Acidimicrobiales bacterium]|nr:MFS transporter [Acidimicrobiales bacterium]